MAGEENKQCVCVCAQKESMKKRDYKGVLRVLRHTKAFPSGGTHTWEGPGEPGESLCEIESNENKKIIPHKKSLSGRL